MNANNIGTRLPLQKFTRVALLGFGLTVPSLFGVAAAAGTTYIIFVGGKASGKTAALLNGELYVPLSLVKQAGLNTTLKGTTLTLGGASTGAATVVAGGSDQRAALAGCMNETLFNGLWRFKVLKVDEIHKDNAPLAPGWGVTVEIRNGWKGTLSPIDSGMNTDLFVSEASGNSIQVDPYNVQPFAGKNLPQGGAFTYRLDFLYPYGTTADQVQPPQKFLAGVDLKQIDSLPANAGAHYSTPNPSFRVDLTCSK